MKIVHVCLCSAVTDGWTYQENILPKYHKKLGFDVTVISSQWVFGTSGVKELCTKTNYFNADGVKMIRIPTLIGTDNNRLKIFPSLYKTLELESPDVLFIHTFQFLDILTLARYAKHHNNVKIYVDNHVDYITGAHGWFSRNILHKILWKYCVHKIESYVTKFYGVLPKRVDFLKEMYDLPKEKCELLLMGGDDELIEQAKASGARQKVRDLYKISDSDFLIITGGKINSTNTALKVIGKTEVLNLMKAVTNIARSNVKLIVFGSISDNLKDAFNELCNENVTYIGWVESARTYELFEAADLVVFPGSHSVMWEQSVAQGKPCIFRNYEGIHHVDLGGNAVFVNEASVSELENSILSIIDDPEKYNKMLSIAQTKGKKFFSYMEIAKRSIELE